jgi:membrane protein implicated in regulation of membrane protease activity
VATFAVLAAIAITAAMRLRRLDSRQARSINTAESGLVGRPAQALAFAGRLGRVRLGDSDWSARLAEDTPPPEPGAPLEVVGVDGTVLIVRPAPAPAGLANP